MPNRVERNDTPALRLTRGHKLHAEDTGQMSILRYLCYYRAVFWCGLAGIVISVCVFALVFSEERAREEARFEALSQDRVRTLQQAIDNSLHDIDALQSFLQATPGATRKAFGEFTTHFLSANPSIQALEWIPRVAAAERAAYEAKARADGVSGFAISERHEQGSMVPAGPRSEYFPVYYVEPFEGNELAVGFDLASSPVRRAALETSRSTGQPLATARITLVQEMSSQYGFLVFSPVYDVPEKSLRGYALGVFRIGDILEKALAGYSSHPFDITLYDESAPEQQVLAYFSGATSTLSNNSPVDKDSWLAEPLRYRVTFEVAGRQWSLISTPSESYATASSYWIAWVLLSMGLTFTLSLVVYLYMALKSKETAEASMEEALSAKITLEREIVERENIQSNLVRSKSRLEIAHTKLKHQRLQLVQQEKMASLGQLAAGVAHEINNPTGFVKSNLSSLRRYSDKIKQLLIAYNRVETAESDRERQKILDEIITFKQAENVDFIIEDIDMLVEESLEGAERIQSIVQNLKSFARIDDSEVSVMDIHECLENTLRLIWNELKYKCELHKEYGSIPTIAGYPGQLSQVFMNVLVNAAQAIPERGEINIRTALKNGDVIVEIADTGAGISKDQLANLFDPFFTTKDVGEGTGLGLAISHGIIQKHGGTISVKSKLGQGSIFTISLPVGEVERC